MDQFYFESGYIADDYYGFIAEATATFSSATSLSAELTDTNLSYFAPDYIATDYFETTVREAIAITGMAFSVAAELTDTNESYFVPQYIDADYFEIPVGITEEGAAAFTSTASITAVAGRVVSGQIALASTGTYVLTARVNKGTDISLSSQFVQSTAVARTRATTIALASQFAQTASAARTRTTASALVSEFSQSALISTAKTSAVALNNFAAVNAQLNALRQGKADLSSLTPDPANPSSNTDQGMLPFGAIASITKAFNAILTSASTQTTSVRKTASAQLAAQSQFTSSTQAFRTKQFTITVSSLFSPSVSASVLINQLSIMEAAASMSITAQATKAAASALSVQATQSANNIRVRFSDSSLSSQFSSSAVATKQFADAVITATVAFTQSVSTAKIAGLQSSLTANFAQTTSANKTFGYSASLQSQFAQSTQASKAFGYSASLQSQFAQSTQASKAFGYSASLQSQFAQATAASRTTNLESSIASQSSVNATPFKIIQGAVAITGAFTPTLTAGVQKAGVALLETATTFQISAVANRSITLALSNIGNLNAQAAKTVGYNSSVTATATLAASTAKLVSTSSTTSSAFSLSATAITVELAQAALVTTSSIYTTRYFGTGRPLFIPSGGGQSNDLDYQFIEEYISSSIYKFGTGSLHGFNGSSYLSLQVNSDEPTYIIPKANETWVFQEWIYRNGTLSTGTNLLSCVSNKFITLRYNANNTLSLTFYKTGANTLTSTATIANTTWTHIAIVYVNGTLSLYANGTRIISAGIATDVAWDGRGTDTKFRIGSPARFYVDDVSFSVGTNLGWDPTQTSITIPTTVTVNDPVNTRFLYHFDHVAGTQNAGSDDISVSQIGAAALTSQFSVSASAQELSSSQANLVAIASVSSQGVVARSAVASLSTVLTQSVTATRIQSAVSTISSQASVSVVATKIVPAASAFTITSTQTAQVVRIQSATITIASAFTPTLTADAFKNHVASLTANTALTVVISKTMSGVSAFASAVNVSVVAIKLATAQAGLSSQTVLTAAPGKLKLATANITGVFNATIGVQYFEGTSLMAATAATMTVSAVKTARITRTLSSAATLTATARVALNDSNYPIPSSDRFLLRLDSSTIVDEYGHGVSGSGGVLTTGKFTNAHKQTPNTQAGYMVFDSNPGNWSPIVLTDTAFAGLEYRDWTLEFWYKPYAWFSQTPYTVSSNTILATINGKIAIVATQNNPFASSQSTQADKHSDLTFSIRTYDGSTFGSTFFDSESALVTWDTPYSGGSPPNTWGGYATEFYYFRITHRYLGGTNHTFGLYNNIYPASTSGKVDGNYEDVNHDFGSSSSANVRIGHSTTWGILDDVNFYNAAPYDFVSADAHQLPPTERAAVVSQFYSSGDAHLESQASLAVTAFTVVFMEATIVQGAFSQSTQGSRVRFAQATVTSSSTLSATVVKTARGAAALTSQFAVTPNVNRIKQFAAAITAQVSLSATLSPVRRASAELSSEFALSEASDKRTGIVAVIEAISSIALDYTRFRDANTDFTSIASNLTAAFKNATGTILLESQFTSSIQAQKITDRPQTVASEFTLSASAVKTARATATITASVTMSVIGVRVRRQAVTINSSLSTVITTNNSKIVRTASATTASFTQSAVTVNSRIRGISKALISTATITCDAQIIINASAALTSQFTGLFIFGKRVNVSAALLSQGFQLTAGDIINFEPSLTYVIPQETRVLLVRMESREYIIEQETRLLTLLEG